MVWLNLTPPRWSLRPATWVGPMFLASCFLTGCPRQPEAPDPGMGRACEALEDCNTASCGALQLCVDGFCEEGSSLIRPCPGVGAPVPPTD